MKSYQEQFQDIKNELEINQQEYKDRQNLLLKRYLNCKINVRMIA